MKDDGLDTGVEHLDMTLYDSILMILLVALSEIRHS